MKVTVKVVVIVAPGAEVVVVAVMRDAVAVMKVGAGKATIPGRVPQVEAGFLWVDPNQISRISSSADRK